MRSPTTLCAAAVVLVAAVMVAPAAAQEAYGPPSSPPAMSPMDLPGPVGTWPSLLDAENPIDLVGSAVEAARGVAAGGSAAHAGGPERETLSTGLSVMLLLTLITLAPSIMLMTTSFVRILIVLAMVRQALGTQNLPPPQVTLVLSIFLSLLVMAPTLDRIDKEALTPHRQGQFATTEELWSAAQQPVRDFMFAQIERTGNWSSLYAILNFRGVDTSRPEALTRADVDLVSLIPAFMLSELKTAFLMGFRIFLPFLVIDMLVSSLLISMSMMMLPPVLVSLPFKLLLFVLVDGWQLVVGGLLQSFASSPALALACGATWV